jgi:PPM family protein phosphatase
MAAKTVSYAASDIGKHRSTNQDSGYAGYQLFFVADGMGGHAGGDIASAIASQRIALSDASYDTVDEAVETLRSAVLDANAMLASTVAEHPELEGMGTTFSGLLMAQGRAITAHIGDSRIYLARDGEVRQVTADHTFVQRLVEMGKITAEEALVHPRRSVLMRVLGDVSARPEIDLAIYDTKPGDRWMLCSDGLSGVVPEEVFERILLSKVPTEEAAELLVGEALEFGAPDNVTVVIADVVRASTNIDFDPAAHFVGSAANEVVIEERRGGKILQLLNPMSLVELLTPPEDPTEFAPESEELLEKILNETKRKLRWRVWRAVASWLLVAAIVVGIIFAAYSYTQTRFYVADYQGQVTIFQGIREELGPLKFSKPYLISEVQTEELPDFEKTQVVRSISAENLADAQRILAQLKARVDE